MEDSIFSRRNTLKLAGAVAVVFAADPIIRRLTRAEASTKGDELSKLLETVPYISTDPKLPLVVFRNPASHAIAVFKATEITNGRSLIIRTDEALAGGIGFDTNARPSIILSATENLRRDNADHALRADRGRTYANLEPIGGSDFGYATFDATSLKLELGEEAAYPNRTAIPLQKAYFNRGTPQGVAEVGDNRPMYSLVAQEQEFDFGIKAVDTVSISGKYKDVQFDINMVTGEGLGVKQISLEPQAAMDLMARSLFRAVWTNNVNSYPTDGKPFPTGEKFDAEFDLFMKRLAVAQNTTDKTVRAQCDFTVKATSPLTGNQEKVVMRPMMPGAISPSGDVVYGMQTTNISIVRIDRTRYMKPTSLDNNIGAGIVLDAANMMLDMRIAMTVADATIPSSNAAVLAALPVLLASSTYTGQYDTKLRDKLTPCVDIQK